ncbi:hypothetical protein GGF31_005762 [Allomyces arbusculus]|nr:hypothetical protein GGF31_005762 [Allomyces arbusculus]
MVKFLRGALGRLLSCCSDTQGSYNGTSSCSVPIHRFTRKRGGPRHATPIQVSSAAASSSTTTTSQRLPSSTAATAPASAPAREARPAVITVAAAPPRARPEIDSFGAKRPVRSTLPIRSDKHRHKVKYPPVLRKSSTPVKRGSRALDQIKQLQRTTDFLIPKISFQRVVRDILMMHGQDATGYRIQPQALAALQEATEAFLVNRIEDSYLASRHARRVTLFVKDMTLARRLSTRRV